ncbi:acetoacetate decarboxylase family protein, partial [bacterium]|nr:acetoacetate decarboxylase family protein [bacterium]MBU1025654.1 acetoacetate decarboxylase family protein [bacterium]
LELKDETITRLIPPPLAPSRPYRAHFIVNHFRKTTLPGVENYMESAILLEVMFEEIKGTLTLSMILDDDNAMIGGREFFGFPKKMGTINFQYDDSSASGDVIRRGVTIAEFKCDITDEAENIDDIQSPFSDTCYNIKCFPDPGLRKFDYPPRVVKHQIAVKKKRIRSVINPELILNSSQFDPWAEITPFKIIDSYLHEYDSTIMAGEVIAQIDSNDYFKFALNRFI